MSRPQIVLIDGSSYLFRAFHALPPLSNRDGEPTGALYGVVNMLRATLKQRPARLAFVLDAEGGNFRHQLYPEYKANRAPTPPDLKLQVAPMKRIVEALGIPILCIPEVEADDVIGTLAHRAREADYDVVISTSDKDFAQLVDERVTLVNTMTQGVLDPPAVFEKFGVHPRQIVDLLALMGDSIDNIPGVEKCGPKTAAKWLGEYGTLENVIANAAKVGGKIGENLRAALPTLPLSKQLATIHTALELPLGLDDLALREPDVAALRELYARYEFNAALKELDRTEVANGGGAAPTHEVAAAAASAANGGAQIAAEAAPTVDRSAYETVLTEAQLDAWIERLQRADAFAFDTETTGIDAQQAELVGLSFCAVPGEAAYVPMGHVYPGAPEQLPVDIVLGRLKPLLEDPCRAKIGQHAKYDVNMLARYGVEVRGVRHDSMLESYVLNSTATRHDMDSLSARYLGHRTIAYTDVAGKGAKQISFAQVELSLATEYAAEDADVTLRLHQALYPKLAAEPRLQQVYEQIEMPLVPVLARMERRGILVDAGVLGAQSRDMKARMHGFVQRAYEMVGHSFSLDSPKQLQQVLFGELGLPVRSRTATGQPSTDEYALEELAGEHELPKLVMEYRTLAKLVGTYTDKLPQQINPRTGRVHTCFHQAVAATGRLSSSDPNLQNIPIRTEDGRRIRQAFVAKPGFRLVAADYSQIELRIMAHLSGDEGLARAFREREDVHRRTAADVFGVAPDAVDANMRRAAKAINFGLMYGMGAHGLAIRLDISRGEAQEYMDLYFARYPRVRAFMDQMRGQARRDGYVETVFGRRLYLPEIASRSQAQRAGAERAAINAPMQGTAADIIKRAMIAVDDWLVPLAERAAMLLQVHDELVLEVREDSVDEIAAGLRERMSGAASLDVPLDVDVGVGANWDEAH
ncbi:MAG TPA: DNA polymerase I [Xanthomonadales bacterium]|nr:DNA polymerase I [Xanthomonadales bacterium]